MSIAVHDDYGCDDGVIELDPMAGLYDLASRGLDETILGLSRWEYIVDRIADFRVQVEECKYLDDGMRADLLTRVDDLQRLCERHIDWYHESGRFLALFLAPPAGSA